MKPFLFLIAPLCLWSTSAISETLVLQGGSTIEGTIIQTNGGEYLLLTDYGTYRFAERGVEEIRKSSPIEAQKVGRLSNFRSVVFALSREPWVTNLTQIPATVIDKGAFKNVPYVSFRCNDDYEVNIYGDLKDPAAIEAGVYRKLLNNEQAKQNCLKFITGLLSQTADKEIVPLLNMGKDIKERSGFSFEITPPDAEDAYLGWWISVYSGGKLKRSRASENELSTISVSKTSKAEVEDGSPWSADEMKLARSQPDTITLVTSSGDTISNAVVVRVIDGAYLIWRDGASGGVLKLSALPEDIRTRFGYDASKASLVYAADEQKRRDEAQARILAAQSPQVQAPVASVSQPTDYGYGRSFSTYAPSSGGRVYVRGYTRRDGTYVQPYTRSAPRRR